MEMAPIRYADNDGVSIAYTTIGEGPTDVIFVPGFVSHLEIMGELPQAQRFFERLASFARVICFDKRGMGLSDRDAGAYTIEAVTEDMIAVLDAVGIESAAVFGVSEGGSAATMFAAAHPERTTALIEFATYARMAAAPDYPQGIEIETLRAFLGIMAKEWGSPALLKLWAPSLKGDEEAERWWARLLRNGAAPRGVEELGLMYEEMDVRPLLPLVRVPSLIIWRSGDRLIPAANSKVVADGIPGAKAVELEGSDHIVVAGDQEAVLGEIEEFLTGGAAGPGPTGCWRRCCSPTSSAQPSGPPVGRSALEGAARRARRAIAVADRAHRAASRSNRPATGSSPVSTVRPGRCAAAAMGEALAAARAADPRRGCTPASASCSARTSVGSRCTSAPG